MSCSFNCLSLSLYLHSTAAFLSLPIHSSAFSLGYLTNFWNCNDLIISLYCSSNLLFIVVNRLSLVLPISCSVWGNVSQNCRLFLPSYFYDCYLFCFCVFYDLNTLFTSNLSFWLIFCFPVECGHFIKGLPILGPAFCVHLCCLLFSAPDTAMACTAALTASATACTISSVIFVCSVAMFCICIFLLLYSIIAYICLYQTNDMLLLLVKQFL